jgi:hypothetical protein
MAGIEFCISSSVNRMAMDASYLLLFPAEDKILSLNYFSISVIADEVSNFYKTCLVNVLYNTSYGSSNIEIIKDISCNQMKYMHIEIQIRYTQMRKLSQQDI